MSTLDFSLGNSSLAVERGLFIPTNILTQDLISQTSEASTCFVKQGFSAKLQAYMINYVISVSSIYSTYA